MPRDHLGDVGGGQQRPAPLAVPGVVGEVHGQHRPHLDPHPHQRERRRAVADVPVGDRGLDRQDRRHAVILIERRTGSVGPRGVDPVDPRVVPMSAGAEDSEPADADRPTGTMALVPRPRRRADSQAARTRAPPRPDRARRGPLALAAQDPAEPAPARGLPGRGRDRRAAADRLGFVTGPLPGPGGIPLVLLGLAIWSSEFEWAHKLMQWFKAQLHRFRRLVPAASRCCSGSCSSPSAGCRLHLRAAHRCPRSGCPDPVDRTARAPAGRLTGGHTGSPISVHSPSAGRMKA